MNIKNTKTKYNSEKGQTLLFVIVAVTIAMAVGVSVSTRTIQSLKRVARTDTSARVIAAAEGGIENLLSRSYSQLNASIGGGVGCLAIGATSVPSTNNCAYVFNEDPDPDETNDLISSRAIITVGTFSTNEVVTAGEDGYSFTLVPGSLKEVNLDGYGPNTIKICWGGPTADQTAIYYSSYNNSGGVKKGGIQRPSFPNSMYLTGARFVEAAIVTTIPGYSYCQDVSLVSGTKYGLRIKVLYNESKVGVFPLGSGVIPKQGYKLTSVGEIVTGSGGEEKATVIVHKSLPYAPDIFDYGIYTPGAL